MNSLILKKIMDYKNFIIRSFSSLFLLSLTLGVLIFFEKKILYIIILIFFIIFLEVYKNFKINKLKIYLILYLILSSIFYIFYFIYFFDNLIFLYCILVIIVFDSFSYLIGSKLGKIKIFPKISPKKTIEGYFFGIIFSIIFSSIFNYYFLLFNFREFILLTFFLIQFAFIGDLIESFYKRISSIKDSGKLIPGHGGFFDRFDSFLSISFLLLPYSFFS